MRMDPSSFPRTIGKAHSLVDHSITPSHSISFFAMSREACGKRYGGSLIGGAVSVWIWHSALCVLPGRLRRTSWNSANVVSSRARLSESNCGLIRGCSSSFPSVPFHGNSMAERRPPRRISLQQLLLLGGTLHYSLNILIWKICFFFLPSVTCTS